MIFLKEAIKALDTTFVTPQRVIEQLDYSVTLGTPPISTYAIPGVNIARTINDIRCMVERRMDLFPGATMHRTRLKDIVYARHIAMYLAIRFKVCNHQAAADYFGYANHTSSIHAVRTVQNLVDTRDADYAGVIEELTARLEVFFSPGGMVSEKKLKKSSGKFRK